MLPTKELESLFDGEESDLFERKESYRSDIIGEAICAFANDLPDNRRVGVIFIGQKDNKECVDSPTSKDLLEEIPNLSRNAISPVPIISINSDNIHGCKIVYIEVKPEQRPPVRFKGRAYIRSGTTTRIATPEEEDRLTQKQQQTQRNNMFFDQQKPYFSVTLDELNWQLIEGEYLPQAVSAETLAQNNRSRKERLASLRLLTADGMPNNTAVLCFHPNPKGYLPGAYIQFARLNGGDIASPMLDHKEFGGSISQQIRTVEEKFEAHISTAASFGEGIRAEDSDYPLSAISQAVRNAVMHRDYENSSAPVRCNWYDDRIEIISPGGVFGNVARDRFGKDPTTDYRNPLLTEALKAMGFVEKLGAGITIIRNAMLENGNPEPKFIAHEKHVQIILYRKPS